MIYGPYRGHANTNRVEGGEAPVAVPEEWERSGHLSHHHVRSTRPRAYKFSAIAAALAHLLSTRAST